MYLSLYKKPQFSVFTTSLTYLVPLPSFSRFYFLLILSKISSELLKSGLFKSDNPKHFVDNGTREIRVSIPRVGKI